MCLTFLAEEEPSANGGHPTKNKTALTMTLMYIENCNYIFTGSKDLRVA